MSSYSLVPAGNLNGLITSLLDECMHRIAHAPGDSFYHISKTVAKPQETRGRFLTRHTQPTHLTESLPCDMLAYHLRLRGAMRFGRIGVLAIGGLLVVVALSACSAAYGILVAPTVAPTFTLTPEPTATPTSTLAPTETPTPEPTRTPEPPTSTPTLTPTPWPTPDGIVRTVRVPILMYHHISEPPKDTDAVQRDLSVRATAFEEQLRYLKENGYQTISLYDLNRHLQLGDPLPEKPIILTFDDGYRDNFVQAFPLLVEYGFTGTFFLITAPIDQGYEGYMTWPQVALMSQLGMDMEPHSYSHPDLRGQSVDYIVWQVVGSKEAIEERTKKTCRFFAYPSGHFDQQLVDVLRSANFWGALSINGATVHSSDKMFDLARVRISGPDDLQTFKDKLNWDW